MEPKIEAMRGKYIIIPSLKLIYKNKTNKPSFVVRNKKKYVSEHKVNIPKVVPKSKISRVLSPPG